MFKKPKIKSNILGSKESIASGSNQSPYSSSSENLSGSLENMLLDPAGPGFLVQYLGMICNVNMLTSEEKESAAKMINKLEEAQISGTIPFVPKSSDKVRFSISKSGIKVENQEGVMRQPLHKVSQMVAYNDGKNRANIALRIGQVGKNVYNLYVYQCQNDEIAKKMCSTLTNIFRQVTSRSV